jgi:hypothetical protein
MPDNEKGNGYLTRKVLTKPEGQYKIVYRNVKVVMK